ncbi:MAG: tetratricopeptide repeat protein [Pseudomonadota bacterium]
MGRLAFHMTLLAALALPLPGLAAEAEDPVVLANRAKLLFEQGQQEEALSLYHRALDRAVGVVRIQTARNLGNAYGSLGRFAEAWAYLDQARAEEPAADPGLDKALSFLEGKLRETHVRVELRSSPDGAILVIGGRESRHRVRAPRTWWLRPGEVLVSLAKDGFLDEERSITVSPETREVTLALEPLPEPARAPVVAPSVAPPPRPAVWPRWAALGGGAALAAAGGLLHFLAWRQNRSLEDRYPTGAPGHPVPVANREAYTRAFEDEVTPKLLTSYALYGIGGAAMVTGVILWLLEDRSPEPVSVLAAPGGCGLTLSIAF